MVADRSIRPAVELTQGVADLLQFGFQLLHILAYLTIRPNEEESWASAKKKYAFVEQLEALRPKVVGRGNRERFDYFLKTFQVMRLICEFGAARHRFELAMHEDRYTQALAVRTTMARLWETKQNKVERAAILEIVGLLFPNASEELVLREHINAVVAQHVVSILADFRECDV